MVALLGAAAATPLALRRVPEQATGSAAARVRVRTITAGTPLATPADLGAVERAIAFLKRAQQVVEAAGYEVQTRRIATGRSSDTRLRGNVSSLGFE